MEAMDVSPEWQLTVTDKHYRRYKDRFLKRTLKPSEYAQSKDRVYIPYDCENRLRNEAATIQFLRQATNIPLPEILDTYTKDGCFYLWTKRIDGLDMQELCPEDQSKVIEEVEEHRKALRDLKSNRMGGPSGIVCPPPRILNNAWEFLQWTTKPSKTKDYVFCHNDLSQSNIIVHPQTLKILAIIDWEYGGYFPEWFEAPFYKDPAGSSLQMKKLTDGPLIRAFLLVRSLVSLKTEG